MTDDKLDPSTMEALKERLSPTLVNSKGCPVMSIGMNKPPSKGEKSLIALPGHVSSAAEEPQINMVPCVGKACALWAEQADEKGRVIGGSCSLGLVASGVFGIANMMGSIASQLLPKPKQQPFTKR